jgi:hypothetical protein
VEARAVSHINRSSMCITDDRDDCSGSQHQHPKSRTCQVPRLNQLMSSWWQRQLPIQESVMDACLVYLPGVDVLVSRAITHGRTPGVLISSGPQGAPLRPEVRLPSSQTPSLAPAGSPRLKAVLAWLFPAAAGWQLASRKDTAGLSTPACMLNSSELRKCYQLLWREGRCC